MGVLFSLCPTVGKTMEEQRKNDWWLPSGIIHWLCSRLREMRCPAQWPLAVKLMGPSRPHLSSFSTSDCYLSSSIFCHLPAGVKFHIRSLAGPRTLEFYDSTRGTQLDSHSILGSLPSPHSPFLCKKKRRLMAFPEWVGGVCGICSSVWVKNTAGMYTQVESLFSVICLIFPGSEWQKILFMN